MLLIQREIIKIVPGKWDEAIELHKKRVSNATRLGSPPFKVFRSMSGQGDWGNTIILEREWNSFAAWESFFEKATTDAKVKKEFLDKWSNVIQSHNFEFYTPLDI